VVKDSSIARAVSEQVAEIERLEPQVRLWDGPEAVHDMRVAVRRLRSILRIATPMLDREWTAHVRKELAWLAERLGAVRDLQVLRASLQAEAETLNAGDAALATDLLRPLTGEYDRAHAELVAALSDERYGRLRALLRDAAQALPATEATDARRLARREFRRLERRGALDPKAGSAALHKRRIRAKRARYAAELVDSRASHRFVARAKEVQDVLGEHQDAVVARRQLRRLARASGRVDAALVAGRLIELQEQRIGASRRTAPKAWKRLIKAGRTAWSK